MLLSKPAPSAWELRGPEQLVSRPLPHGRPEAIGEGLLGEHGFAPGHSRLLLQLRHRTGSPVLHGHCLAP